MTPTENDRTWHDREWRDALQTALVATGRAYLVVVLDGTGKRSATFATLPPDQVPVVLRGIAASLERGDLTIESIGGGN